MADIRYVQHFPNTAFSHTSDSNNPPSSSVGGKGTPPGYEPDVDEKPTVSNKETTDRDNNLEALIKNPLHGISKSQLMRNVEAWAQEKGLVEHIPILKKGALVAQNPAGIRLIDGEEKLTDNEIKVLEDEVNHRWRMPRKLLLTIATCSIGAAVQGWDQTGSNGANLWFPEYYGIAEDTMLVGLVNAGPYIGSA